MDGRALAIIGAAAAAGGGTWPWVREAARYAGSQYAFPASHDNDDDEPFRNGRSGPVERRSPRERTDWEAQWWDGLNVGHGSVGTLAGIGSAVSLVVSAASSFRARRADRRRNRRLQRLEQLDGIAAAAYGHEGPTIAAELGIDRGRLTAWASTWARAAAGPERWAVDEPEQRQG